MTVLDALRAGWRRRHTLAAGPTLAGVAALSMGRGWLAIVAIAVAAAVWVPLTLRACVRRYQEVRRRHASH